MKNPLIIALVLVFFSVTFAIIFSLAEHSYSKLNEKDVRWLRSKGDKRSNQILNLLRSRINIVATMEFWKQFFVVALIFFTNFALLYFSQMYLTQELSFWITFIIVFVLTLVFVFLVPKIYADNHVLIVARAVTPYILPFEKITAPFTRRNNSENYAKVLQQEESHDITEEEKLLYKRIVDFPQKTISHILTPRVDIKALNSKLNFQEMLAEVNKIKFSRIPVYEENIDKIVGILYSKDLIPHYNSTDFYWKALLAKPLFVTSDLSLSDLFEKFKSSRKHMAIVVDEYGGCYGLVTFEDLLEVILGNIEDENDREEVLVNKINEKSFEVNPKIHLSKLMTYDAKFQKLFEGFENLGVESLNGYILNEFNKMPSVGDELHIDQTTITIEEMAKNIIKKVKINFR